MTTPEFRVRPVIRHIVTRFTSDPERGASSLETLGEFANEGYAEIVAEALRERVAPRKYAIVQRSFETSVLVYYAADETEAQACKASCEAEHGGEFRIFSE